MAGYRFVLHPRHERVEIELVGARQPKLFDAR